MMYILKQIIVVLCGIVLVNTSAIKAQVPVRDEPRHHPVFQNKYIRLLDVWIPPGDTSLFHIHATPSLFVILSNAMTGSQIKGENWVKAQNYAGTAWYRSFTPDTLIHRVSNLDTVPYHVNDIELLSIYNNKQAIKHTPLPFTQLFSNERAIAYRLTESSFKKQIIKNRGPLLAELIKGEGLIFYDIKTNRATEMKAGKYWYIEPGTSFYFDAKGSSAIDMVLFEIR